MKLSTNVLSQAGRGDYKNHFILNTSSSNYIYNNYSKFISFTNNLSFYAIINIGVDLIITNYKGTIKITIFILNSFLY